MHSLWGCKTDLRKINKQMAAVCRERSCDRALMSARLPHLDLFVTGSRITIHSFTSPNLQKYSFSPSVEKGKQRKCKSSVLVILLHEANLTPNEREDAVQSRPIVFRNATHSNVLKDSIQPESSRLHEPQASSINVQRALKHF